MDITRVPTRSTRCTGFAMASLTRAEGIILHPAATAHRDRHPHPRLSTAGTASAAPTHHKATRCRWCASDAKRQALFRAHGTCARQLRPRLRGERSVQRENGRSRRGGNWKCWGCLERKEARPWTTPISPLKSSRWALQGSVDAWFGNDEQPRREMSSVGPVLSRPAVPLPARRSREVAVFPHGSHPPRSAPLPGRQRSLFHLPLTRFPLIYRQWIYRA